MNCVGLNPHLDSCKSSFCVYVCLCVCMQCVTKAVFRGMVTMVRALIAGLEHTYQSRGPGGMASTMMILEIMHTHYWEKEGSSKSDTSNQSLVSASQL